MSWFLYQTVNSAEGETDLSKRSILVAFWDKHGLLRSPGLFQRLVPLNTALGLTRICNRLTGRPAKIRRVYKPTAQKTHALC